MAAECFLVASRPTAVSHCLATAANRQQCCMHSVMDVEGEGRGASERTREGRGGKGHGQWVAPRLYSLFLNLPYPFPVLRLKPDLKRPIHNQSAHQKISNRTS